jgi:hypothetical protein
MIDPQLSRQALTRWVTDRWVLMQGPLNLSVGLAHIVERTKEVRNQLRIIGDVLEATNRI